MSLSPVMAMRAAGLLAGVCLVAVLALQTWRVPAAPRALGVQADVRAVATGEVGVAPAGRLLARRALTPGGAAARGRVRLTNRTAGPLAARPRVTGGDPALDEMVELELTVAGRVVFRGPLGRLRGDVSAAVPLARAGSATVRVAARLPGDAGDEALGRSSRWELAFSSAEGAGR